MDCNCCFINCLLVSLENCKGFEMIEFIIIGISLIIAGIFNGEMDTIRYTPEEAWFQSNFWLRNLWKTGIFRKTFGFMTLDGWHFCKGIMIYSMLYPAAFLLTGNIIWALLIDIPLMMFLGIWFELSYNY